MASKVKSSGGGRRGNSAHDRRRNVMLQEERRHILSPQSEFFMREAYKTLRTNVSFSLTGEEESKLIVVTSSLQNEGKSITAVNLAVSFAQTDRRVLIVDCDLRRPKLARLFGGKAPVGLSNLILDHSLFGLAVTPSGIPGLDVIFSGDIPPNPSELLSSPRMQRLMDKMREQYDIIILDTPPVNMVIDAVVLAPLSDGVLFVVRAGQSERGAVIHAVEQLQYANAKLLGFVLNGGDAEASGRGYGKYKRYGRYGRYGYYGYGGYGYGYGYSSRHTSDTQR